MRFANGLSNRLILTLSFCILCVGCSHVGKFIMKFVVFALVLAVSSAQQHVQRHLFVARDTPAAAVIGNKVIIAGGYPYTKAVDIFDLAAYANQRVSFRCQKPFRCCDL